MFDDLVYDFISIGGTFIMLFELSLSNLPRLGVLPHLPRPIRPAVGSGAHSAPAWVGWLLANAVRVQLCFTSCEYKLKNSAQDASVLTSDYFIIKEISS